MEFIGLSLRYRARLRNLPTSTSRPRNLRPKEELQEALAVGPRMYQWLAKVNKSRSDAEKLSFSIKGRAKFVSIEEPARYSVRLILRDLGRIKAAMPSSMRSVLFSRSEIPNSMPVPTEDFLKVGREISLIYDTAARWVGVVNDLEYYKKAQIEDVRGYVYLSRLPNLAETLERFVRLSPVEQSKIRKALINICMNNQDSDDFDRSVCEQTVIKNETSGHLNSFYFAWEEQAKLLYDSYFSLHPSLIRKDLLWTEERPEVLYFPFLLPPKKAIADFLKTNVEDEFRITGWNLKIDYVTRDRGDLSRLEFQPGVLSQASYGKILMDENEPTTEWTNQLTIRHEFGHLLGFVDCYVEFFDEAEQVMVNYQLDSTDIMCSATGHFKPSHYDRLKETYFNKSGSTARL